MKKVLLGDVAVVTGAARGIGREIALTLAQAGAKVVVCDILEDETADPTHKKIIESGGKSSFVKLDVTDFEQVQNTFKKIESDHGGLHILVNNAGINDDQLMGRMKPDNWKKVLDINLNGCFNTCRSVVPNNA